MKVEETWHKLGQELKNHRLINSNSATASCPAHQDKIPSLSLKLKKDIILFKCHAGCTFSEITKALGMSSSDFKFMYLRPSTLFTARFMGESNIFEGKIVECRDGYFGVETLIGQFSFDGKAESGKTVHVSLRPEQIRVGVPIQDGMVPLGKIKVKEVIFKRIKY